MLIGRPITILYFLAIKIIAEDAEEFTLRVSLRTLRSNFLFDIRQKKVFCDCPGVPD
jgi:hypothetical protein